MLKALNNRRFRQVSLAAAVSLAVSQQAGAVLVEFVDFQMHNTSAAPVYTWTAAATGTAPGTHLLRPTFQVNYDLNPIEETARKWPGAGPFKVTETFLLVDVNAFPDRVVKANVATATITAQSQNKTFNPPWGTTTIDSETAASGGTVAEYRMERRRAILNESSSRIDLTAAAGASTGGGAAPTRNNSAGITYGGVPRGTPSGGQTIGAPIPTIALPPAQAYNVYTLSTVDGDNMSIHGFNNSGFNFAAASSGSQVHHAEQSQTLFAGDVSFNGVWNTGDMTVGELTSPEAVWSVLSSASDARPYSAHMFSGLPPVLPGDGMTSSFSVTSTSTSGSDALWLFFDGSQSLGSPQTLGFLVTPVPEPATAGVLAALSLLRRRRK